MGGKAAADYEGIGFRTMKSLASVWQNWQTIPMVSRGLILEEFRNALNDLPEDFRAVMGKVISPAEPQRRGGKNRR